MTIFNQTKLTVSLVDALRVLFGKAIHLTTEIDVATEVEVVATRQTVRVDRWRKPSAKAKGFSSTPRTEL